MFKFLSLLFILISCATQAPEEDQFEKGMKELNLSNSMAFIHDSKPHYFALKKDSGKCTSYYGYVNGKHLYTFSPAVFKELNEIYEPLKSPEQRISRFMRKLDELQKAPAAKKCFADNSYVLAFSPLMVFTSTKGQSLEVSKLRLGMTTQEVKKILRRPWEVREEIGHQYFYVSSAQRRIVLYFHKDKLHSWLSGSKPTE